VRTTVRRIRRLLEIIVPVVMVDQVSKGLARSSLMPGEVHEVLPFANLRLGFNRGISFGFLPADEASGVLLLIGVTALISIGMAIWSVMAQTWQEGTALALILGGALGNLIDRVRDGMVTDFIDLHALGYHWPTFNGADIAITLGAIWLVMDSLRLGLRGRKTA